MLIGMTLYQWVVLCTLQVPPLLTAAVRRGLVAEQGAQAERRRRVTALLGLGDCNAKQLLRQLNTFSFSQGELQAAVQQVEAAMAAAASAPGGTCFTCIPADW